jgi:hypothetical protein
MNTSILKSHQVKDLIKNYPITAFDDLEEWFELRDKVLKHMKSQFITIDGQKYLPKGTMLYHGSLKYPFLSGSYDNNMTFFGLDTTISLWYILELIEESNSRFTFRYPRFGYLYAFRLKENLPITKIIETIIDNPKDYPHCSTYKNVCIGLQFTFRGEIFEESTPNIHSLSIELTLFYNHYKEYLELDSVYLVDPLVLKINATKPKFEPQKAILQKIVEYRVEYDKKIDKKTYNRYYRQSNWHTCEYDCGVKGTYEDVLEHKKMCSKCTHKGSDLKRKNTRKKKMNKYTSLIKQKKNCKVTKKKSKRLDIYNYIKGLKNKLYKYIKD